MRSERGFIFLSAVEMAGADRMAIETYGIDVLSLMENAGLRTAELAREMLGGAVGGKEVCCLVGRGNNGGDGLVAARHLHNWGARVRVVLGGAKETIRDTPGKQLAAAEKIGVETAGPDGDFGKEELLIDALLGYGSKGDPREPLATLITKANQSSAKTLAVDVPSGLDGTSGEPGNPCVEADATLTFGFPKVGFLNPKAMAHLGDLYLADISFPPNVYRFYSQETGIFQRGPVVRMW
ncbi:MAG: NAD(P)H-hydrate epimerase [Nitrososphaerota archaeon]|jgi:NAD(P)H-hydrate epimerase|nr:NAD(P)H-hydrate epimerase [Nitrososphaerota archaeon]MDG6952767.1 NAD(P)H-hydrate epimerase [Nitrososphaerota archaeon]